MYALNKMQIPLEYDNTMDYILYMNLRALVNNNCVVDF